MSLYVLDTNICIYIIKRNPKSVYERLEKISIESVGISNITYSELLFGVENSQNIEKNRKALGRFIEPLVVWDYDLSASLEYGKIRAELTKRGELLSPMDTLISAHAKSIGGIFVTNNEKEFKRVNGLQIENWAVA